MSDRRKEYEATIRRWADNGIPKTVLTEGEVYSLVHLLERHIDRERDVFLPRLEALVRVANAASNYLDVKESGAQLFEGGKDAARSELAQALVRATEAMRAPVPSSTVMKDSWSPRMEKIDDIMTAALQATPGHSVAIGVWNVARDPEEPCVTPVKWVDREELREMYKPHLDAGRPAHYTVFK